ncbi:MAG: DUF4062 domain-containing protein [Pirellulales bacterium]
MNDRQVFLSHTSLMARIPGDRTYVQAAIDAINANGFVPRDMRFFTADDRPPATLCVDTVAQCDVYIGVFGLDYGSPVRERPEVSYTELEFETALLEKERRNIRVLAFLLDATTTGAGSEDERQTRFRQRVLASGITSAVFSTPDRLEFLIHCALHSQIDPFDEYMSKRLPEQCNRWFRPDDRVAFHPRDQFVPLSANWDDGGRAEDIAADLVARLEAGRDKRLGIAANYGQGKTFLSWKVALTLANRSESEGNAIVTQSKPIVPLFYPLKELQPNSDKKPLTQVVEYIQRVLPNATSDLLFDSRDSLLIPDAADEIPVNRENLTAVLRNLLKSFEAFPRLALLLTFRTGLYPDGATQQRAELPGFSVAQLDSWEAGGQHWERLLEQCEKTNIASFPGGWEQFRDKVAGPPGKPSPLLDLTSRPLWCRMIIERRDTILQQEIRNVADLYHAYVDEFFKTRSGMTQILSPDHKRRVLELLATSMAKKGTINQSDTPALAQVTETELRQAAAHALRILDDSDIAEYIAGEMRAYSLLNCHRYGDDRAFYSFGHYSFQEFFQALAFLRLLQGCGGNLASRQEDLSGFARRILHSEDLVAFIVGRLGASFGADEVSDALRRKPDVVFGSNSEDIQRIRAALIRCWLSYARDILQKPKPNLIGFRLNSLTCEQLDFSEADLSEANLGGSRFLRCNFAGADLSEANCRGATFEKCVLTNVIWIGADLAGAEGI